MNGSTTIEMAYIMPVILLIFSVTVYSTFYLYDKNILYGLAYEAAVIGSNQYNTKEGIHEKEIEDFILQKSRNELILFST